MKTYAVSIVFSDGEKFGAIWTSKNASDAAEALSLTLQHLPSDRQGTEKKISIEVK